MSQINFTNGKFFLLDTNQNILLVDVITPHVNHSWMHSHQFSQDGKSMIYPLMDYVKAAIKKIYNNTPSSLSDIIIYLRVINELLRKPQVHKILHIGRWSTLDEALATILPKFNPANKLYCFSDTRPLGKIEGVNFIFAEDDSFPIAEEFFNTVIISGERKPVPQEFLALKDFGKIYFMLQNDEIMIPPPMTTIFQINSNFSVFEVALSPQYRQTMYLDTHRGQLLKNIAEIRDVVERIPDVTKDISNATLDEYLQELSRAENLLAKIFLEIHSDTIKFNFNLLKEFLIDLRLGDGSAEQVVEQYKILLKDFEMI